MEDNSKQKDQPVKSSSLDVTLRVIGFIADAIAIVSVLIAVKLPNVGEALPAFINPAFAFGIWVIGAYLYVSYLHKYWRKNADKSIWAKRFVVFLIGELVFKFRHPLVLLPGIIWIIFLILIVFATNFPTEAFAIIGIPLSVISFLLLILFGSDLYRFFIYPLKEIEELEALNNIRTTVDEKWKRLKPLVRKKLSAHNWIGIDQCREIMATEGFTEKMMSYVLTKYAAETPDETFFGDIYIGHQLHKDAVLINREKFTQNLKPEGYYYQ